MPSQPIQHAIGLHLYQPAENLRDLLRQDEAEVRRLLLCYERIARHAHKYAHVARLHVALSGVLLEQLRDPELINACRHLADIPAILEGLRSAPNIEFIGTGYRHAPLPLIPAEDWQEQLHNERVIAEAVLGRVLKGYWPPASLFAAEVIPALVQAGYEYVLLPSSALVARDDGGADPYQAYRLCHERVCIAAVPLDPGFSHAQEVGLDVSWFADEVRNGVAQSAQADPPYLLSTWSDGENGEWFRRMDEDNGFFGQFFSPYMEFCETGEFPVIAVLLSERLRDYPPEIEIGLRAQAPIAGVSDRIADGAQTLRDRLFRISQRYWSLARTGVQPAPTRLDLQQARELILRAEDSGFLLGDPESQARLGDMLDRAERLLEAKPEPQKAPLSARATSARQATTGRKKPRSGVRKAPRLAKKKPRKRRS